MTIIIMIMVEWLGSSSPRVAPSRSTVQLRQGERQRHCQRQHDWNRSRTYVVRASDEMETTTATVPVTDECECDLLDLEWEEGC